MHSFTVAIHKSQKVKQCKSPSAHERINRLQYIHMMEYYLAIKYHFLPLQQHGCTWRTLC